MNKFIIGFATVCTISTTLAAVARADAFTCTVSKVGGNSSELAFRCSNTDRRGKATSGSDATKARYQSLLLAATLSGRQVYVDCGSSFEAICEIAGLEMQ